MYGIEPWKERDWIGKTIKINNVSFKVEKNIPRCVAINLKPQSDDNSFNLLQLLKKNYNHFDLDSRKIADGRDLGVVTVSQIDATGSKELIPYKISFAFVWHTFNPDAAIIR